MGVDTGGGGGGGLGGLKPPPPDFQALYYTQYTCMAIIVEFLPNSGCLIQYFNQ